MVERKFSDGETNEERDQYICISCIEKVMIITINMDSRELTLPHTIPVHLLSWEWTS